MTLSESNKIYTRSQEAIDNSPYPVKEASKSIFISQEKNFANKHGFHYRSSAQFYFIANKLKKINTRLILFNYFLIKNRNQVAVCVTLRDKNGKFIDRKNIDFHDQNVIILDREFWDLDNHTGSVEVEYFSLKNLVIPYAAVIGVYETKLGISYVHTYSRCYSNHELETGFTVMESCESNWTIRDSDAIESFTILHNGHLEMHEQEMNIKIISESGRILEKKTSSKSTEAI